MIEVIGVSVDAIIPENDKHKNVRVTFGVDRTGVWFQYKDYGKEIADSLSREEGKEVLAFEERLIFESLFKKLGFDIPSALGYNTV